MAKRKIISASIVALMSTGCSMLGGGDYDEQAPLKVNIFAAHDFLGSGDFERITLKDGILIRECGMIHPSASLQTLQKEAARPKKNTIREFISQARALMENQIAPPPPDTVASLRGKGVLEMEVELGGNRQRFVTSVDAVRDEDSLISLRKLFSSLRGDKMCGRRTFSGIM